VAEAEGVAAVPEAAVLALAEALVVAEAEERPASVAAMVVASVSATAGLVSATALQFRAQRLGTRCSRCFRARTPAARITARQLLRQDTRC
jgi:hypothetical protein